MMTPIPSDTYLSPPPPVPPSLPPLPPVPPAMPGHMATGLYYTLTQEYVRANTTNFHQAAKRCYPLASSVHPALDASAYALLRAPAACGTDYQVITCSYSAPQAVIERYNTWLDTSPLEANPDACMPMTFARSRLAESAIVSPPPSSPLPGSPPTPPRPPPEEGPRPPPPPSPPPALPAGPPPPGTPPVPPIPPPCPPPLPAEPPAPPHAPQSIQLINEPLCHPTCVSWSIDDINGEEHVGDHQSAPCGAFFASLCSTDADTITQLLDLPPNAPPPPLPPYMDLDKLYVTRVLASGGFKTTLDGSSRRRADEVTNNPTKQCTDAGNTPCIALGREQPVSPLPIAYIQSS